MGATSPYQKGELVWLLPISDKIMLWNLGFVKCCQQKRRNSKSGSIGLILSTSAHTHIFFVCCFLHSHSHNWHIGCPTGHSFFTLQGEAVGKSTNKGWFSWEKPSINSSIGERTSSLDSPSWLNISQLMVLKNISNNPMSNICDTTLYPTWWWHSS